MMECADVRGRQDGARAALRERWSQHNAERRAAFQKAQDGRQECNAIMGSIKAEGAGLSPHSKGAPFLGRASPVW